MKYLSIIIAVSISLVCYAYIDVDDKFMIEGYYIPGGSSSNVQLDGYYSSSKNAIENFIVFFESGKVFCKSHSQLADSPKFTEAYFVDFAPLPTGRYRVVNDTIYATIPTSFYVNGMRSKQLNAHYVGHINDTSIDSWRMVPPYPKINFKLNQEFSADTTSKPLYFVKYDKVIELKKLIK